MVFPNFFYYLCKAQLSHIPPLHIPLSRETASPCHQAPHSPHGTRAASGAMHTRCTSQKAMLTRHTHATHPRLSQHTRPHTTTPAKGYATRAALPHSTHALHTTPRKGLCHAHASCAKCRNAFPCSPPFLRRKSEPPQPKYYILQYYM